MSFHVGQKVCCIDDGGWPQISVGSIYTIDSIRLAHGDTWLRLIEVTPEHGGWRARRFRPIVERKTDIAIFKRMLLPQGVDA